MVGHSERQTGDNHVGQGLPRHIDALPEAVGAEQHGVHVVLELLQHQGPGSACALHETRDADLVEEWLHQLGDFLHQLEVGEEHEGFAVRQLHEVLDPVGQSVAIALGARVGHLADHVELHLPRVIERSAFNGSTSKLDMGSSANLALTTGSVSCWIYMPSLPAIDGIIFEKGDMSNQLYGYGMYYSSGRLVFETANASKHTNYYANTGVTLQAGVWYHIVCTWNGTTVVTYLNGVQRLSASQVTPCVFNNHDFGLGKNLPSNTAGFPGTIDEVGVWNRVLTSSEVTSLYNTGTGFQYPFGSVINMPPVANAGTNQTLPAS